MPKFSKSNVKAGVLKPEDIPVIRRRAAEGESYREISKDYGVSTETIGRAVRGDTWKDLPLITSEEEKQLRAVKSAGRLLTLLGEVEGIKPVEEEINTEIPEFLKPKKPIPYPTKD